MRASVPLNCPAASPCLSVHVHPDLRNPRPGPDSPPIKAKTPAIVPHQGKSRQTPKSPKRPGRARHSVRAVTANPNATVGNHLHGKSGNRRWQAAAGTGLPALPCLALFACFAVPPPGNSPLCDFAPPRLCVKNPVIKSQSSLNQGKNPCNRASSRQIKANAQISKTPR